MRKTFSNMDEVMEEEAEISKKDEGLKTWDDWFESKRAGDDFMNDRDQPEHQEREEF